MQKNNKKSALQKSKFWISLIAFLGLSLLFTILGSRWVLSLGDPTKLEAFYAFVDSLGWGGWLLLLAIQYVQIVVAFIPGGPIQVVAGALYGIGGGVAICLVGAMLASATVFALVKRFGSRAADYFVGAETLEKYRFLQDERKLELTVFLLFLLPGLPKDAFTYLFALTPMKTRRFVLLSTVARVPALVTSVLAGERVLAGDWWQALILFLAIGIFSAVGLLLHRKLLKKACPKQNPLSLPNANSPRKN